MTATITVKNAGPAAAGTFLVRWQPWILATPLSTQVNGLAAGASANVNLAYAFPSVGHFDGTASVDPAGAVPEINEFNNTRATGVDTVQPNLNVQKIAQNGFGDSQNSYSWSMAWFKGKLYVGTARSVHCVEAATLDFYYPGQGYYGGSLDGLPEANCPAERARHGPSRRDLAVHAGRSVEAGVPVADDPEPTGTGQVRGPRHRLPRHGRLLTTALYVGGVTADEYIPELAASYPPRILRSVDGESFAPLPNGPGKIFNTIGAGQWTVPDRVPGDDRLQRSTLRHGERRADG